MWYLHHVVANVRPLLLSSNNAFNAIAMGHNKQRIFSWHFCLFFIASFFSSDADGHRAWFEQGRDRGDQQVGKAGKEVEEILTRIKF